MKRRFLEILLSVMAILSVFLLLYAEETGLGFEKRLMEKITLFEEKGGKLCAYTLWEAAEMQSYCLVLPSMYADEEIDFSIQYDDKRYKLYIDDKIYSSGDQWSGVLGEKIYSFRVKNRLFGKQVEKPVQVLISSNIPTMMFTVESIEGLFENKDFSNKQYVEKGSLVMYDEQGVLVVDTPLQKMAVRGNSSAIAPKKPFRIEFGEAISLCNMEEATQWNLLADYKDATHIRNKLVLDWAYEMTDNYSIQGEYVEVFINGEYQGLYLLTETATVGENRLEIDVDNSVFVEMDLSTRIEEKDTFFVTKQQHYWEIHSEEYKTQENINSIKEYFDEIESALYSIDGRGEKSGKYLQELIDFDSWTDAW